jgi:hypothetical protein
MRGDGYQGASSGMEFAATKRMMQRLYLANFKIDMIITDKDGKILKAMQTYYPNVKNMHCSAHVFKNFRKKIRNSDILDPHTQKTMKPSLKRKYAAICIFTLMFSL